LTAPGSGRAAELAVIQRPGTSRGQQSLFDIRSRKYLAPQAELPGGAPVVKRRYLIDRTLGEAWQILQGGDGRVFSGLYQGPGSPLHPFPFWPDAAWASQGLFASSKDTDPSGCLAARQLPGRPVQCLSNTALPSGEFIVGGRWTVQDQDLLDLDTGERFEVAPCEHGHVTAILDHPPRVLGTCSNAGNDEFFWWSPEDRRSWTMNLQEFDGSLILLRRPILNLSQLQGPFEATEHWFDMERAVMWKTPPTLGLFLSDTSGADRRLLAEPADYNQLWLLDLDTGRIEVIIDDIDCSGTLQQDALRGDRALVSCMSEAGAAHAFRPAQRLDHYEWTELIDLKAKQRYRSRTAFEGTLTESGIAVARRPGRQVQLVVLEKP
jgi:hypothetical protein